MSRECTTTSPLVRSGASTGAACTKYHSGLDRKKQLLYVSFNYRISFPQAIGVFAVTLVVALVLYVVLVVCIVRFFRALALLDRQMRNFSAELIPPSSPDRAG